MIGVNQLVSLKRFFFPIYCCSVVVYSFEHIMKKEELVWYLQIVIIKYVFKLLLFSQCL